MAYEDIKFGQEPVKQEVGTGPAHMSGVELELLTEANEILASREPFYGPASLEASEVFCGDKGNPLKDGAIYLHWFGGVLKPVHNLVVMKEIQQLGSVTDTFEEEAAALTPVIIETGGVKGGVHSDDVHEHGEEMHVEDKEGDIGCKYALLRQQISSLIYERGNEIVEILKSTQPELFQSERDDNFALKAIDAFGRLAERDDFYTSGRRVAIAAVEHGAKAQVLDRSTLTGDEDTVGIINKDPRSALDNKAANTDEEPRPAYTHDDGALMQAHRNISHLYPYDMREVEIASAIDTVGTLLALGIPADKIAVRPVQAA